MNPKLMNLLTGTRTSRNLEVTMASPYCTTLGRCLHFCLREKIATISICHTGRKKSEIRSDDFVFLDVSNHSVKKIWIKNSGSGGGESGLLRRRGRGPVDCQISTGDYHDFHDYHDLHR